MRSQVANVENKIHTVLAWVSAKDDQHAISRRRVLDRLTFYQGCNFVWWLFWSLSALYSRRSIVNKEGKQREDKKHGCCLGKISSRLVRLLFGRGIVLLPRCACSRLVMDPQPQQILQPARSGTSHRFRTTENSGSSLFQPAEHLIFNTDLKLVQRQRRLTWWLHGGRNKGATIGRS